MAPKAFVPSRKLVGKYMLSSVCICVVFFLPWVLLALAPEVGWLFAILYLAANALGLLIAIALIPPYCRTIRYELGERELVVRRGLITRAVDTLPYDKITNLAIRRGPLDRLLGLGTLAIHTAGYSSQNQGPEAKLAGLEDCAGVHEAILEAVRQAHAQSVAAGPASPVAAGAEAQLLGDLLAEVRAIHAEMHHA